MIQNYPAAEALLIRFYCEGVFSLAKLERDNVINVIEGVRYKLPPEKIKKPPKY